VLLGVSVMVVVVPDGVVMFACTVSIPMLSVAFAVMLIVVPWLMAIPVGLRLSMAGVVSSVTVKAVVTVLLMLLLVSLAMKVMLYCPGGWLMVGVKVTLKVCPVPLVMVSSMVVLLGNVMLASTVSTPILSVALTVILNCVCCVSFAGVMFDANTLGMSWSFMVNVVVMD